MIVVALTSSSAAAANTVSISPVAPRTTDSVQITVTGETPDACWEPVPSQSINGNYIQVNVFFN
jgi:hypothetical protein